MCTQKHRLFISFFAMLILLSSTMSISPSVVYASGDLQITTQNGATFVTTQAVDPAPQNQNTPDPNSTTTNGQVVSDVTPPTGFAGNIGQVINFILQAIIVLAVLLVFGNLVYGGILWITSGGDKSKTEAARNRIVASVVGLVVVAGSYAIFVLILHFLGFSDLNDLFNKTGTINNPGVSVTGPTTAPDSSKLRQENLVQ